VAVNRQATGGGDVTTTVIKELQRQRDARSAFTAEVQKAAHLHARARVALERVATEMRNGKPFNLDDVKRAVVEMFENLSRNTNPLLWLVNLRFQHAHTSCHCLNTCVLSMVFGLHLRKKRSEILMLGLGGILHDLGLTRIPPLMLEKPEKLSDKELEIVHQHAREGYAALKASGQVAEEVLAIVHRHHERADGNGYPDGLFGESVPPLARMVAIVDAYDTMTGDYGYRPPMTPSEALRRLNVEAGEEYGPELVQEFIRCLGTYPLGSVVELNSGAVVMVVGSNPQARLKPVVLQLRDEDGKSPRPRPLYDLASFPDSETAEIWGIHHLANPLVMGLDLPGIVSEEISG
jgi:HD-GYP domain-containing protein (c-di-GMP phosphodiesterase class II)